MAHPSTRARVDIGDYLTDGKRLVQVLDRAPGVLICEDVATAADRPAEIVKIGGLGSGAWRQVIPKDDERK